MSTQRRHTAHKHTLAFWIMWRARWMTPSAFIWSRRCRNIQLSNWCECSVCDWVDGIRKRFSICCFRIACASFACVRSHKTQTTDCSPDEQFQTQRRSNILRVNARPFFSDLPAIVLRSVEQNAATWKYSYYYMSVVDIHTQARAWPITKCVTLCNDICVLFYMGTMWCECVVIMQFYRCNRTNEHFTSHCITDSHTNHPFRWWPGRMATSQATCVMYFRQCKITSAALLPFV